MCKKAKEPAKVKGMEKDRQIKGSDSLNVNGRLCVNDSYYAMNLVAQSSVPKLDL